ncbi:MAG: N-acetylmuramoyl-L-alanine amidase [Bergeyella sp.]
MAVFISAGHNTKGQRDPGAVKGPLIEAVLTEDFKKLVVPICVGLGLKVITDRDDERLSDYLKRIKTGAGSVVLEFHFDAGPETATGTTVIVGDDADRLDKAFAKELAEVTSATLGIKNRGVISEAQSRRGRLGLMREQGTVALLEVCFITNKDDMAKFNANKVELATKIAKIVKKYEDLIP